MCALCVLVMVVVCVSVCVCLCVCVCVCVCVCLCVLVVVVMVVVVVVVVIVIVYAYVCGCGGSDGVSWCLLLHAHLQTHAYVFFGLMNGRAWAGAHCDRGSCMVIHISGELLDLVRDRNDAGSRGSGGRFDFSNYGDGDSSQPHQHTNTQDQEDLASSLIHVCFPTPHASHSLSNMRARVGTQLCRL